MTPRDRDPSLLPDPCPGFEEACTLRAWGEPVSGEEQRHIDGCERCLAAVSRARVLAEATGELVDRPPARAGQGLTAEVLAATTRRGPIQLPRRRLWAGAAGLAAAGLATLTWWRGRKSDEEFVPDFAEVGLELLEEMELAEHLDLLEILDALEEMDDA